MLDKITPNSQIRIAYVTNVVCLIMFLERYIFPDPAGAHFNVNVTIFSETLSPLPLPHLLLLRWIVHADIVIQHKQRNNPNLLPRAPTPMEIILQCWGPSNTFRGPYLNPIIDVRYTHNIIGLSHVVAISHTFYQSFPLCPLDGSPFSHGYIPYFPNPSLAFCI